MKYIYGIICHKLTNPLIFTVKKLLESIHSQLIIHIDAKTSFDEVTKIKEALGQHPQLEYVSESKALDVRWGGVSQIEVMLLLMQLAQSYDYEYFSLISGDDIPLSLNSVRENFFEQAFLKEIEFIGCTSVHDAKRRLEIEYPSFFYKKNHSIFEKLCCKILLKYLILFRKKDISHLPTLYKGSTWFTLTKEAVNYVLEYVDKNPQYLNTFENSLCGDEVFFQTIIFNSYLRNRIHGIDSCISDCEMGMRFIDWKTGPDYPRTLDSSDFPKMIKSGMLFSRKVDTKIELKELENLLKG